MKSIAIAVLSILALMPLVSAEKRSEESPRTISVSGTAETKMAPDMVIWRIELSDENKILSEAKKQNDEKIESVLSLRKKLGVGEGDVETGSVRVSREYEHDERGNRGAFRGFSVRRSVTIRERDLKKFDEFLDSLVLSAEMEVSFNFESSKLQDVRADTRLKAVRIAREKAAAMAEAAGAKLGKVLTIDERPPQPRGWLESSGGGFGAANGIFVSSTPSADLTTDRFVPGALSVQITVYTTFELE